MPWLRTLPMRVFGHAKGVLGRLGPHPFCACGGHGFPRLARPSSIENRCQIVNGRDERRGRSRTARTRSAAAIAICGLSPFRFIHRSSLADS
jgi:hypothetical protein